MVMTPLGHCLTPQHFTHFRKKTESGEKQWCNWLSSRTAHPWWWLKLPLPDLLPRGKRQALVFHDMSHFTRFPKSPLSSTRSNGATGAAGCVDTPHHCWLPLPLPDLLHKWFLPPNLPKDILHPSAYLSYTWISHLAGRVK